MMRAVCFPHYSGCGFSPGQGTTKKDPTCHEKRDAAPKKEMIIDSTEDIRMIVLGGILTWGQMRTKTQDDLQVPRRLYLGMFTPVLQRNSVKKRHDQTVS